jgi:homoserine O-acetyltransferase
MPGSVPPREPEGDVVTGAWSPGDAQGDRRFVPLFDETGLELEAGGSLGPITVAYETWGALAPAADNAILVLHALTGDSHATGSAGPGHPKPGWWSGIIGPGTAIDTDRWFVVCPNVLGGCQGTTGPASPAPDGRRYGSRFPVITIRDQVRVEVALADVLGIASWAAVVGGSMGGMRALEWAVMEPARTRRAVLVAVGAAATAEQIGLCSLQIRAIRADPFFADGNYYDAPMGPLSGLSLARGLGQMTYRSPGEFDGRFGRKPQGAEEPLKGGRYAIESYLEHHGDSLVQRFDANSYIVLSEAMNHHDVGRGRGGIAAALAGVTAATTVVGVSSDRLYPVGLQRELARLLPGSPPAQIIDSDVGHDGFLVEVGAIGEIIHQALTAA